MNKVILMGRLTRDPEVRYSQSSNPVAVAKYGLAVRKSFTKQGESEVDFFNITAFGKIAENASKYLHKGDMVSIVGRLQTSSWDNNGTKRTSIEIIIEEQYFITTKRNSDSQDASSSSVATTAGEWPSSTMQEDDDLPF